MSVEMPKKKNIYIHTRVSNGTANKVTTEMPKYMSVGGGSLESKKVCLYNFSFQINPRFSWLIPHNMLLDVNFPSGKYQPFQVRKKSLYSK